MILDLTKETQEALVSRLENIQCDTQPLWGKMNAVEMCKHCRLAMELPLGRLVLKPNFVFKILFGKWIKTKVTNSEIYKPNSPTAPEFKVHDKNLDFLIERGKLLDTIDEFVRHNDIKLSEFIHPIFGKMTAHEWRKSQWKHLDHHFRQFGV